MIPKIIHYCWFGANPLPPLAIKCIESWKKFCPDYEIKRWDESNFDYKQCQYMKDSYKEKKWGFVPDFARFKIIYDYGGIYLDTDVELIRSLDSLLSENAVLGFESKNYVNGGNIIMSIPQNYLMKEMYEIYNSVSFYKNDGTLNTTPSPTYNTEVLLKHGLINNNSLQYLDCVSVYPTEYFCPKSLETGRLTITENTYSIHHFDGSWLTPAQKKYEKQKFLLIAHFGFFGKFLSIIPFFIWQITDNGMIGVFRKCLIKILKRKCK